MDTSSCVSRRQFRSNGIINDRSLLSSINQHLKRLIKEYEFDTLMGCEKTNQTNKDHTHTHTWQTNDFWHEFWCVFSSNVMIYIEYTYSWIAIYTSREVLLCTVSHICFYGVLIKLAKLAEPINFTKKKIFPFHFHLAKTFSFRHFEVIRWPIYTLTVRYFNYKYTSKSKYQHLLPYLVLRIEKFVRKWTWYF